MEHGQERNRRSGKDTTYGDFQTPEGMVRKPLTVHEYIISERWCETCGEWVQAKGIMGALLCVKCGTPWDKRFIGEME